MPHPLPHTQPLHQTSTGQVTIQDGGRESLVYLVLCSRYCLLDVSPYIYTWFFENRASNKCPSLTLIGNLMTILTGNVKSHLKNKFLNTQASI